MTKYAGKGVVFGIEITATPGTYTPLAQVRGLGGPSLAQDALDVSCHESPGFYRQFVPGFHDAGEISLDLLFDPVEPTQDLATDGLLEIYNDGEVHNFQIIWPDAGATEWDFAGIVTGYEPEAPVDEVLAASVTIKLTGAPTFPVAA